LTASPEGAHEPAPRARVDPKGRRPLRVIVADNDPDALDLVVLDLTLEGHSVVATATQGDDAVAACRRLHPDVLVVDQRMPPGPAGLEVVRRLRDQRNLRIVMYSNYTSAALRHEVERLGATFLRKGELAALRAVVNAVTPAVP
jgi:CheY-like chemotaxis protein